MSHLLFAGRWPAWILALSAGLALAGAAQAQPRQATLTIRGDVVCQFPAYADHQVGIDTITFVLPEIDGPVSGQGQYSLQGTGYTLAGISASAGEVRDDAELVLTYGQWNYQGTWINAEAPGVPTKAKPVVLPLEPGAQTTVSFQNAMVHQGGSCSGAVIYQIDFTRETQEWQVDLKGQRVVWHRLMYFLVDPADGVFKDFDYEHGVTFDYDLGAVVTLERRAGAWGYKAGVITRAKVNYDYRQSPPLYRIKSQSCHGCTQIAALAGQALAGWSDGNMLMLHWPYQSPVVTLVSQFAMQCAPGPRHAGCESLRKSETNYADQDTDFFQRAAGRGLELKDGPASFVDESDSEGALFRVRHDFVLKRLK